MYILLKGVHLLLDRTEDFFSSLLKAHELRLTVHAKLKCVSLMKIHITINISIIINISLQHVRLA